MWDVATNTPNANPFADTYRKYLAAGWTSPLALPTGKKFPPPSGFTGRGARVPTEADFEAWGADGTRTNIALHLDDGIIGLDVDDYGDKPGAATLADLEAELGALPQTWKSTARPETVGGISYFRVPLGLEYVGGLPGIEIVQAKHRYAVAPPSVHPNGSTYEWTHTGTGEVTLEPPQVSELPELPPRWVAALSEKATPKGSKAQAAPTLSDEDTLSVIREMPSGEPCDHIKKAAGGIALGTARHDNYRDAQLAVLRYGRMGCPGAEQAVERLGRMFIAEMTSTGDDVETRAADWERGLRGAVAIVAADSQGDTCGEPVSDTRRSLTLTPASTIKPTRVRWSWEARMALGALSLVAGPEGLGKSTLVYWIVAEVTRGRLPGEHFGTPKAVIIAATEDSWEHTIVPRLMAADADLERVYRVDVTTTLGTEGAISLPADIPALSKAAADIDAVLLVLDPLTSRLSSNLDTHKDSETRLALEPLVDFANRNNVAVIGIMHFNKSGSTDPLALIMASKAFTAVARSVSTVIKDPEDETEAARLFGTVKNNLGRSDLPTLRFTIAGHCIPTDDGDAWTGKLIWGQDATGTIGDALTRAADSGGGGSAAAEAAEWLEGYLEDANGCATSKAVKAAASIERVSDNSLRAARKRLGVRVINIKEKQRRTLWALSGHECKLCLSPRGEDTTNITNTTRDKSPSRVSRVSRVETGGRQTQLARKSKPLNSNCASCNDAYDSAAHAFICETTL